MALSREDEKILLGIRKPLFSYCYSLTRNRDNAEDLVQETLLKCIKYWDRFEKGTNLQAWAVTIARNQYLTEMRRNKFRGDLTAEQMQARTEELHLGGLPHQESHIYLKQVFEAMASINPEQGSAVISVALGENYEDIAQATDVPVGTVKSRVFRGRRALCQAFDPEILASPDAEISPVPENAALQGILSREP